MSRGLLLIVLLVAMVTNLGVAGGKKNLRTVRPVPLIMDEGTSHQARVAAPQGGDLSISDNPNAITWVAVDEMANAFGPATVQVTPLVFDPGTGALALIHRGGAPYGTGNQLWYNISLDGGATWRRVGNISAGQTDALRYPNVDLRNPHGSSDTSQVWVPYAAPNLRNAGTFGSITYGIDLFGQNAAFSEIDDGPGALFEFFSSLSVWSATGSATDSTIFWATRRGGGSNEWYLWRTLDYSSVSSGTPPTWANANFINPFSYIGGTYRNGKSFFNVISIFAGDSAFVENFGYSVSSDGGVTWSGWTRPQPDWVVATGVGYFYDLLSFYRGTGNFASYPVKAALDGNDRMHYFAVTVDSPWTLLDRRHISEIYQTATGWEHKWVVQEMNENTGMMYPSTVVGQGPLDQTYHALSPSVSPDGQVLTLTWLDAASPTSADTLPDIWFSWRRIDGTDWSTPVNLTETPGFQEILLHAAPVLRSNGGDSYTLFLGRSYQTGITTYPPESTVPTTFFVGSHTFTAASSAVGEEPGTPADFRLSQNYPNPFNPATMIEYTVKQAGVVSLKVFNTLGQEVATLLDGNVVAGTHQVRFDGASLPSGVYVYRMQAGSYSESRKMVLLK
jgi:hypothetical protein